MTFRAASLDVLIKNFTDVKKLFDSLPDPSTSDFKEKRTAIFVKLRDVYTQRVGKKLNSFNNDYVLRHAERIAEGTLADVFTALKPQAESYVASFKEFQTQIRAFSPSTPHTTLTALRTLVQEHDKFTPQFFCITKAHRQDGLAMVAVTHREKIDFYFLAFMETLEGRSIQQLEELTPLPSALPLKETLGPAAYDSFTQLLTSQAQEGIKLMTHMIATRKENPKSLSVHNSFETILYSILETHNRAGKSAFKTILSEELRSLKERYREFSSEEKEELRKILFNEQSPSTKMGSFITDYRHCAKGLATQQGGPLLARLYSLSLKSS